MLISSPPNLRLQTDLASWHATLTSTVLGGTRFCAQRRCDGRCGLPALTLSIDGRTYKAQGSQAACGPVWHALPDSWEGEKHPITVEDGDPLQMMWW